MKLLYVLFAFLSIAVGPIQVHADRNIAFVFAPSGDASCNDNDEALMAPIFNISNYKIRRQLRSVNSNTAAAEMEDRGLLANECKNRCAGFAGGWCHAMPVCSKKRRELQDDFNPLYSTCSNHVAEVNARLDELIASSSALSTGCKELIRADNRNATCEDGILIGEISGFSIRRKLQRTSECIGYAPGRCPIFRSQAPISVVSNEVVTVAAGGSTMYTNIQIDLIPCFSTLDFSVVGPNFNRQRSIPMVSGGSLDIMMLPEFTILPVGTYNVTAIPNSNIRKEKRFTLIIKK